MFRAMADLLYLSYERIRTGTYLSLRRLGRFAFARMKTAGKGSGEYQLRQA